MSYKIILWIVVVNEFPVKKWFQELQDYLSYKKRLTIIFKTVYFIILISQFTKRVRERDDSKATYL